VTALSGDAETNYICFLHVFERDKSKKMLLQYFQPFILLPPPPKLKKEINMMENVACTWGMAPSTMVGTMSEL